MEDAVMKEAVMKKDVIQEDVIEDVQKKSRNNIGAFYGWKKSTQIKVNKQLYEGIETPFDLYEALLKIWCADSCALRMREAWTPSNPAMGQCSITAFLVQDIFGGEVYAFTTNNGNLHCYNRVNDIVFDLTSEQFGEQFDEYDYAKRYDCSLLQDRESENHFKRDEKYIRYQYIKSRLPQSMKIAI